MSTTTYTRTDIMLGEATYRTEEPTGHLTRCTKPRGTSTCGQPVRLVKLTDTTWCDGCKAAHNRAAAQAARVDDGRVSAHHARRCFTEAVDGECVCR